MHIRFSTAFAAIVAVSVASAMLRTEPLRAQQQPPPSVTVIAPAEARGVLGHQVRSTANEDMGRIVDIVVDRDGKVVAAVIDFGGFLGVGSRRIAVDWSALKFADFADKEDKITLELTRDQVRAAPEYKDNQTAMVLGAAGKLSPLPFGPE